MTMVKKSSARLIRKAKKETGEIGREQSLLNLLQNKIKHSLKAKLILRLLINDMSLNLSNSLKM
jgi:hypothetical protein